MIVQSGVTGVFLKRESRMINRLIYLYEASDRDHKVIMKEFNELISPLRICFLTDV